LIKYYFKKILFYYFLSFLFLPPSLSHTTKIDAVKITTSEGRRKSYDTKNSCETKWVGERDWREEREL
jgi:hypothetical protein